MSASREKKTRQDLAAQGITDPKKIREAEEKAKARKSNILYGVIAGVFVLVAAALLVWNSGVLQRNAAALSIDGEKYSASQVNYFYHNIKNNILNGSYSSLYGVSSSTPLDQQVMNDTAKMFLGVEDEGEVTWDQFIHDYAIEQMTLIVKEAKEAEANGHGADDHTEEEVASTIEQYTAYAKENGYSLKEYLKMAFGKTMTVSTFKDMIRLVDVASHYASEYSEELSYTASDLESYYNDNKSSFNVASYESLYFKGTADSTTDADGNTIASDFRVAALSKTPRHVLQRTGTLFRYYSTAILGGFWQIATGQVGVEELSGPIGTATTIGQAMQYGWQDVFSLLALITINIGIFNLLPIPALDGCKLIFLLIEAIFGRAAPQKLQMVVNTVGMALLLWLMVLVTMQDLTRFL